MFSSIQSYLKIIINRLCLLLAKQFNGIIGISYLLCQFLWFIFFSLGPHKYSTSFQISQMSIFILQVSTIPHTSMLAADHLYVWITQYASLYEQAKMFLFFKLRRTVCLLIKISSSTKTISSKETQSSNETVLANMKLNLAKPVVYQSDGTFDVDV